jgi:hypothetical protein
MFIKLTHGGFEFPVVVNSNEVVSIWPSDQLGKGSEIKFRKNHKSIHVLEDMEEILALLAGGNDAPR